MWFNKKKNKYLCTVYESVLIQFSAGAVALMAVFIYIGLTAWQHDSFVLFSTKFVIFLNQFWTQRKNVFISLLNWERAKKKVSKWNKKQVHDFIEWEKKAHAIFEPLLLYFPR